MSDTHQLTIRLGTDQNKLTVDFNQVLDHVVAIYIDDYNIRAPNGSALTPSLWSLRLSNGLYKMASSSNLGEGFCIPITNATNTFREYNPPRLLATCQRLRANKITIELLDAVTSAAVTFADASFSLTFVMRPPHMPSIDTIMRMGEFPRVDGNNVPYGQNLSWNHY